MSAFLERETGNQLKLPCITYEEKENAVREVQVC